MSMPGNNTNQPLINFEQKVVYKECTHNLTISLGKVTHDGCSEYLGGCVGLNNKDTLLCACCGCHRSFHRKHIVLNDVPVTQAENGQEVRPKRKKRTTFSPEQRSRLIMFADSMGWKPRKDNKDEIQQICSEMGMSRRMFLVWLSNNRHRAMQVVKAPDN